ncbi:MAG: COX15/CtaA family protein [Planctomycetaceae bacterium]|nr:COX15/CtaA family protein [Planctomycetaceae bacterium]
MAVITAWSAMPVIILGALTTTYGAGMAFPDWPTSDGQGMFSYPWLRLLDDISTNSVSGHKLLEHSHRLAGIVVGISAILLMIVSWRPQTTKALKWLGAAVLLTVITQGLLGGFRVLAEETGLAMLHGLFAAIVFSLMCVTATVSSTSWTQWQPSETDRPAKLAKITSLLFLLFLLLQYSIGGLIRHPMPGMNAPVNSHLGFGILALLTVHVVLVFVVKTKTKWLRSAMRTMIILTSVQIVLGFVTYATKFGMGSMVVVEGSTGQIFSRTTHMVVGVLLIASATVLTVRCFRVEHIRKSNQPTETT